MRKIENLIISNDFDYLQPYFYLNSYALRCELGIGDTEEEYLLNVHQRAELIYKILFPDGADAFFFNYYINDLSNTGEAENENDIDKTEYTVECEIKNIRFLLECQNKYRHTVVKNLKTHSEPEDEDYDHIKRNRVICYLEKDDEHDLKIINRGISEDTGPEISFVSFKNECIMSIYDDRGCDVVFTSFEKMNEFYSKLKPYFLAYDVDEMERRLTATG